MIQSIWDAYKTVFPYTLIVVALLDVLYMTYLGFLNGTVWEYYYAIFIQQRSPQMVGAIITESLAIVIVSGIIAVPLTVLHKLVTFIKGLFD